MIATQLALPQMQGYLASTRRAVGLIGERMAYELLYCAGYRVSYAHPNQHRGDLVVINDDGVITKVEVKTARQGKDRKWRFTLEKKGHTSAANSDMIILFAVLKTGDAIPFVIPTADIRGRRHIVITSHPESYRGRFTCYRQKRGQLTLENIL